jgi:hypothetical protein
MPEHEVQTSTAKMQNRIVCTNSIICGPPFGLYVTWKKSPFPLKCDCCFSGHLFGGSGTLRIEDFSGVCLRGFQVYHRPGEDGGR